MIFFLTCHLKHVILFIYIFYVFLQCGPEPEHLNPMKIKKIVFSLPSNLYLPVVFISTVHREQVRFHGGRHVAPPCFYTSSEWTNGSTEHSPWRYTMSVLEAHSEANINSQLLHRWRSTHTSTHTLALYLSVYIYIFK